MEIRTGELLDHTQVVGLFSKKYCFIKYIEILKYQKHRLQKSGPSIKEIIQIENSTLKKCILKHFNLFNKAILLLIDYDFLLLTFFTQVTYFQGISYIAAVVWLQ